MVNVTEKAKQELKRLLDASVDWPWAILRLIDKGEGKYGIGVDVEAADDYIVEYGGRKLLAVESKLASRANKINLDYEYNTDWEGLVISEEP
ncbi:hypothetical protein ACFLVH_06025 [Chloroflexota bacterium]